MSHDEEIDPKPIDLSLASEEDMIKELSKRHTSFICGYWDYPTNTSYFYKTYHYGHLAFCNLICDMLKLEVMVDFNKTKNNQK